ncbi:disulfide bond formation protein B [Jiella marina]|uniref:disulfide bond formation protein B n=1 Tax=Jiella sp. LLJ827 TaxID=2917712 RepID=UPI002100E07F|nr:disulfide bond formation protein B [Jiella sp. LLJ827]MCQ0989914.1 disulfide bond formation protein B [Jiella sp. LLJ827]
MTTRVTGEAALTAAWVVTVVASLSVLFIGEVLGRMPCLLCWYQRAFMFPLPIVLGLGLWWQDARVGRYGVALSLGGGWSRFGISASTRASSRSPSSHAPRRDLPAPTTTRQSLASPSRFCRFWPSFSRRAYRFSL